VHLLLSLQQRSIAPMVPTPPPRPVGPSSAKPTPSIIQAAPTVYSAPPAPAAGPRRPDIRAQRQARMVKWAEYFDNRNDCFMCQIRVGQSTKYFLWTLYRSRTSVGVLGFNVRNMSMCTGWLMRNKCRGLSKSSVCHCHLCFYCHPCMYMLCKWISRWTIKSITYSSIHLSYRPPSITLFLLCPLCYFFHHQKFQSLISFPLYNIYLYVHL